MAETVPESYPLYVEHRIARGGGSVYVRDYLGAEPAFILLHGFPDNGRIYTYLIPHLVQAGHRVVTIDFLGFGESDKLQDPAYSFTQQLGDLEAVIEALEIRQAIPVGHDAGGPAAVNYSLKHPERTTAAVLINAFYGETPGLRVPEFIELFANRNLQALHAEFLKSPQQFGWLLNFQRSQMQRGLTPKQQDRYADFLGPLIDQNFRSSGSGPAFAQMTSGLQAEIAANTSRLTEFRQSKIPLILVWGNADPYLHISDAAYMQAQRQTAVLSSLQAGHWPQIDEPAEVARLMLQALRHEN